jgi:hypothetical protein
MDVIRPDAFRRDLATLLRDLPRGVAARLTDYAVARWDGREVVFAHLREDDLRLIEEEFELRDRLWHEWADELTAWFREPRFERFEEIESWIADSPPRDVDSEP